MNPLFRRRQSTPRRSVAERLPHRPVQPPENRQRRGKRRSWAWQLPCLALIAPPQAQVRRYPQVTTMPERSTGLSSRKCGGGAHAPPWLHVFVSGTSSRASYHGGRSSKSSTHWPKSGTVQRVRVKGLKANVARLFLWPATLNPRRHARDPSVRCPRLLETDRTQANRCAPLPRPCSPPLTPAGPDRRLERWR